MSVKKYVPVLVGAAALLFGLRFLRKGVAAQNLNTKIANLKLMPINKASIVLSVINPTSTPIGFNSITADVLLNGNAFATINTNRQTTINANSSINIELPIKINPLEGAKLAIDLLKRPKGYVVNVVGTINSNNINFPVNIEYVLK